MDTYCLYCQELIPFDYQSCPACGRAVTSKGYITASDRGVAAGGDINAPVITGDIFAPVTIEFTPLPKIPPPPPIDRPPAFVDFVGRQDELAYYADTLLKAHIAVIAGMAGVGKTALASTLAQKIVEPDNIFWHSFQEDEGIDAILWDLASFLAWNGQDDLWRMLNRTRQTGERGPAREIIFSYLLQMIRGHGYLLCLDDFQFVEDDPFMSDLVKDIQDVLQSGDVSLIITTRRIPDFVPYYLFNPLAGLSSKDALELLNRRGIWLPEELFGKLYKLTDGNAELLTLAIYTLQHTTNQKYLIDHLVDSDDIERYLIHEVDEGLTIEERNVMEAVAALMGYPSNRETIQAVLKANPRRALRELSDQNLLITSDSGLDKLYRQHALLQTFYYDQLDQNKKQQLHLRAGAYFENNEPIDWYKAALHYARGGELSKAAQVATYDVPGLINQGQVRPLLVLLESIDCKSLDNTLCAKVCLARGQTNSVLGETESANYSFQQVLLLQDCTPASTAGCIQVASACLGLGELFEFTEPEMALEWLRRGQSNVVDIDTQLMAALAIKTGEICFHLGNYPLAIENLQTGLALLPGGISKLHSAALMALGSSLYIQGDIVKGKDFTDKAIKISRQMSDHFRTANILINQGIFSMDRGDWQEGIACFQEAIELANRLGSQKLIIQLDINLGTVHIFTGDDDIAFRHLREGLELSLKHGYIYFEVIANLQLAELSLRRSEWQPARASIDRAEQLGEEIKAETMLIDVYRVKAEICLGNGLVIDALSYSQRSVQLGRELGEITSLAIALRVHGQALFADRQLDSARAAFEESLALLEGQDKYEQARTQVQYGLALFHDSHSEFAGEVLRQAKKTFRELGAKRDLALLESLSR